MINGLQLIGYWEEKGEDVPWIHPRYLVDPKWEISRRDAIVDYLKSGMKIQCYLGYSHCRMDSSIPDKIMGDSELTDGVYVWPEGLPLYVEKFSIRLPDEFVEHASSLNFQIPANLDQEELQRREINSDFWERWCRENRPSLFRKVLSKFRY